MGYDVFIKRKDKRAPRWLQCYELVSQLLEECVSLGPVFNAPVEMVNHKEIRRFNPDDSRLVNACRGLTDLLKGYVPTNKFEGQQVESPYPREIILGTAFSLKTVIDYAMQHKVKLFVDG
jgi:hypothetical protein